MIQKDKENSTKDNPRFLVKLDLDEPRTASIVLEGSNNQRSVALIEYDDVVIRCSGCLSTSHVKEECPQRVRVSLPKKRRNATRNKKTSANPASTGEAETDDPDTSMNETTYSEVKVTTDEEGFTTISYKKQKPKIPVQPRKRGGRRTRQEFPDSLERDGLS